MESAAIGLFALDSSRMLGAGIAAQLGLALGAHIERRFEDGESYARPDASVRGKDVFVIGSLHGDAAHSPDERLLRLLFFLGAVADAAAARVTAVIPYLCYARQDRKLRPNDAVTPRYVARMFEAVAVNRVAVLEVHNLAAMQNAFRLPTEHIEAWPLFVDYFAALLRERQIVVVAPDAGGVKRAEQFRQGLSRTLGRSVAGAFVEKQRGNGGIGGESASGPFADRDAVIVDDMICTGTTLLHAARICRERGAQRIYAAAAHGLFAGNAAAALIDPLLEKIVVSNSIAQPRPQSGPLERKLVVIDAAALLATVIREIHAERGVIA